MNASTEQLTKSSAWLWLQIHLIWKVYNFFFFRMQFYDTSENLGEFINVEPILQSAYIIAPIPEISVGS